MTELGVSNLHRAAYRTWMRAKVEGVDNWVEYYTAYQLQRSGIPYTPKRYPLKEPEIDTISTRIHGHMCPREECQEFWYHDPNEITSFSAAFKKHACPKCGAGQMTVYKGPWTYPLPESSLNAAKA